MNRYIGLLIVIVLAAFVYLVFTQLAPRVNFGNIFSTFFLPKFHPTTSTPPAPPVPAAQTKVLSKGGVYAPPVPVRPTVTPPSGFTLSNLSPYYGQVRIGDVVPEAYYFGSGSQLNLNADYSLGTALDITGWRIKTNNNGTGIVIPQAVADYNPSGYEVLSDIVLNPGNYAVFYSASSPINYSIRLNECTGYLNNHYNFSPVLPDSCPYIDRSLISSFSGVCQSVINSLGNCSEPNADQLNQFGGQGNAPCQYFLSQLNYSGCYSRYRSDAKFFSNEWWIWMNMNLSLDAQHDRVLLLDKNGLLVDLYTY